MNTNLVNLIPQFFDSSGNPLNGGTLETYVAGTSTALATYPTNTDALAATNANSTSISIDSSGYPSASSAVIGVFLRPGKQYKFILKNSAGTTQYTLDNISNLTDTFYDANGNEVIKLVAVASAINEISVTNAAISNAPSIAATGDDTNIGLTVRAKGSGTMTVSSPSGSTVIQGAVQLNDINGNELLKTTATASAINEFTITNAATAGSPVIEATGGDTNIDFTVKGKGTGKAKIGQATSTGIQLEADQPILDSSGNELVKFSKTASAVNEFTIGNTATGGNPTLSVTGDDGNINQSFQAKGSGVYNFLSSVVQGTKIQLWDATGGTDNYLQLKCPDSLSANRIWTLVDKDVNFTPVYFSRGRASAQTISTATFTKMQLATSLYDSGSYWDAGNFRFTPLIAGVYSVNAAVQLGAFADTAALICLIYKNGSAVYQHLNRHSGTSSLSSSVSGLVTLNGSTDYIELFIWHDNGSNALTTADATANFLTAVKIAEI